MNIPHLFKKILYIIEGYATWIYEVITGESSIKAMSRYKICKNCEHNKNGICKLCGCIIKAKVRVTFMLDENGKSIDGCPSNKW